MKPRSIPLLTLVTALVLAFLLPAEAGKLRRLLYLNYPGVNVTNLYTTNLFGTVTFPDAPDQADYMPPVPTFPPFNAETLLTTTGGTENYGGMVEGYLTAPETGNYTFWLSSDDEGQFFLNTDSSDPLNPSKTNLICWVPGYSGARQWDKFPEQQSSPVALEAGKTYYLKILQKEGTGGDYIVLGWQTPSGALERPMPAWHFQPIRDTRWGEADAEVIIGQINPKTAGDPLVWDGNQVVIYANVNLPQPVTYQWKKDGNVVPGATKAYNIFRANVSDSAQWSVEATSGATTYVGGPVGLIVNNDKPVAVSAGVVPQNPTALQVVFSEDVNPLSATNTSNYLLPGATVQSAAISPDLRTVTLKTSLLTPTQVYTLTVQNVQDMATPANTMDPVSVSFVIADGSINFRVYTPTFATDLATLRTATTNSATANATYTNNLFLTDQLITTTSPAWNIVPLRDNYVGQVIGYLTAPESGQYKFAVASDDHCVLYLGTSDQRSSKREICNYNGSTGRWTLGAQLANQQSALITLVAGQRYYIEAVYRDGTGGDGVTICWQTPSGSALPTTNPGTQGETEPFLIPAKYLSPFTAFGNLFFRTNLPATLNAAAATQPVLRVTVDGSLPYYYQWFKNGSPIAGATNSTYTVPFLQTADSGASFSVTATNNFSSTNSVATVITVTADSTKPAIASVGSLFKQQVKVRFTEPVTELTATNLANYLLLNSANAAVAITGAVLDTTDSAGVTLETVALPETDLMKLVVQNVSDQAAAANVINPATNSFRANNFDAVVNINNTQPWSVTANGDQILLTAGGSDIWGTADQGVFLYKTLTGNFDYRVQGISLETINQWCKMGIMARASTAANSRNAFNAFTPVTPSQNTYTPQIRDLTAGASTSSDVAGTMLNLGLQTGVAARPTVAYPSWVRLQRIGNTIYYYYGSNGTNWTFWTYYDSATSAEGALPSTVQLGLAHTSHDTARTANGVVASFSSVNLGPLTFTLQPTNSSVVEGGTAVFACAVTGNSPYFYQWRTNGVPFLDATNAVLTLTRVPFAYNGLQFSCRVTNPYGEVITSDTAVLTVAQDTVIPTVRYFYLPKINVTANEVRLIYSEPMNRVSAETIGNYQITPNAGGPALGITGIFLEADDRTLVLSTDTQVAGTLYKVVVNSVIDQACCPPNAIPANSTDYFFYAGSQGRFAQRSDGFVFMEAENAQRTASGAGADWQFSNSRPNYSGRGYMLVPTVQGTGGGATAIVGGVAQGTGARMEYDFVLTRPATNYTVWVRGWVADDGRAAGDNDSIYIGLDGNLADLGPSPGNANYSYLQSWGSGGWDWRSDRNTGTDPLILTNIPPGTHTFIIWSREDGMLADKICIEPGIRSNAGNSTEPSQASSNGGLGDPETWDWQVTPPGAPTISINNPTNTQIFASGSTIQIDTTIVAPSPVLRVEFLSGTNIIGTATASPFGFTWPNVQDGIYSLTARITDALGYQVTSAAIQVVVDGTKPVPYAVGSLRGTGIGVYFTDLSGLETVTATTPGNYIVNGGAVTVTGAVLEPDNLAVMLSLSAPISGAFTVQVANVADRGFGPNVMNATTLQGTVVNWPLLNRDVGTVNTTNSALFTDPIMPGFAQAIGLDGYYVRAGGHDIWDAADGMHFIYLPVAGNFDVAVRVQALRRPNEWSKAGLMVREDLDGNSRNHMIATAPTNGQNLITMQWRPTKGAACASIVDAIRPRPSPIPNAWLRVARAGDQYTFYWGTNGTAWTVSTNVTLNYSTVYLGVATTSHDNGTNVANVTSAYYRDLTGVPMISGSTSGSDLVVCWPPSFTGARLEGQVNPIGSGLGANWTTVTGSAATNRVFVPIQPNQGAGFYRLAYP